MAWGGSVEALQGQTPNITVSTPRPGLAHLHMPLLAQCVDHTALNGPATGPTDGDAHLVMAGQAIELTLQLSGLCSQLLPGRQRGAPGDIPAPLQGLRWRWWVPPAPPAPGSSFQRSPAPVQHSAQGRRLFDLWALRGLPVPQTGPGAQDSCTGLAEGSLCCALSGPLRSRSVLWLLHTRLGVWGRDEGMLWSFFPLSSLSNSSTNPSSLPWPSKPLIPPSQLPGAQPSLIQRGLMQGLPEQGPGERRFLQRCPLRPPCTPSPIVHPPVPSLPQVGVPPGSPPAPGTGTQPCTYPQWVQLKWSGW